MEKYNLDKKAFVVVEPDAKEIIEMESSQDEVVQAAITEQSNEMMCNLNEEAEAVNAIEVEAKVGLLTNENITM